jgi:hypothetical protein
MYAATGFILRYCTLLSISLPVLEKGVRVGALQAIGALALGGVGADAAAVLESLRVPAAGFLLLMRVGTCSPVMAIALGAQHNLRMPQCRTEGMCQRST